jgi:hypothetical protein
MLEVRGQEHMKRVVAALFAYADGQLGTGKSPKDVEQDLLSKGMEQEAASSVVEKIVTERQRQADQRTRLVAQRERARAAYRRRVAALRAEAAQRGMTIGAIICLAGVCVTLVSYSATWGGGIYVVAWGAILFGMVRFLRGAALASTSRDELQKEALATQRLPLRQ